MACVDTLNMSSELNLTPSRKRKRQFEKFQKQEENAIKTTAAVTSSCFTNAAFTSTPKKILGKRRISINTNNGNALPFVPNIALEVKSILEIVNDNEERISTPKNPFEVLRKPPKKKKRQAEEVACFENPALNLELPEKQFNPYEVVRDLAQPKSSNCFVNTALNLKIQDPPALRNPFEIQRESSKEPEVLNLKTEIDPVLINPFEIPQEAVKKSEVNSPNPCNLRIGLPFVPTIGCRIDFKDMSMSQLTPSTLFAEKLIFSPVPKAKISLGSIGEETTMDIGKELDRYQLELENSINEAKQRKNCIIDDIIDSPPGSNLQVQIVDIEKKIKFTQKLTEISEDGENEEIFEETSEQTEHHTEIHIQQHTQMETETFPNHNPFENCSAPDNENDNIDREKKNPFEYTLISEKHNQEDEITDAEDLEELYGSSVTGEDSFDFKTPAPFVRAYTKASEPNLKVSKESLKYENYIKSTETEENTKKPMNVKNIIRKSIRKLMHPHHQNQEHKRDDEVEIQEIPEHEKHNGFMNAIRQSLRRKPTRNLLEEDPEIKECEISIIDSSERTMKLKSNLIQTDYAKIEDLTNEKKHSLRNSLRRSSRDVRNQFMKSIFHKKHEEYDFNK